MVSVFRSPALILASTGAVLLLSACGDARPGSTVSGDRRSPLLNRELVAEVAKTKSAQSNDGSPFDQYDDSGKLKKDASPKAAPKNSGMMGRFESEKAPAPAENDAPEVRKPLSGNPYYSKDTEHTAPIARPLTNAEPTQRQPAANPFVNPSAAQASRQPVETAPAPVGSGGQQPYVTPDFSSQETVNKLRSMGEGAAVQEQEAPVESPKQQLAEPQEAPAKAPAKPVQQAKAEEESNFPFAWTRAKDKVAKSQEQKEAEEKAEYVPLESVPPKPERAEEIRRESNEQLAKMQEEHAQAQLDKQALASEQSDLAEQQGAIPTVDSRGKPLSVGASAQPAVEQENNEMIAAVAASAPVATAAAAPAAGSSLPSPLLLKNKKAVVTAN